MKTEDMALHTIIAAIPARAARVKHTAETPVRRRKSRMSPAAASRGGNKTASLPVHGTATAVS